MKPRYVLLIVLAIVLGIIATAIFCYREGVRTTLAKNATVVQTDTLYIRDTIRITDVQIKERKIVDTAYFAITDTISINDTVYLPLPREIKVYEDSLFKAQVSGVQPNLDWAEVYPQTKIVTEYIEVKKRKPWGVGISVGYGVGLQNNVVYATPYIGVGITYDIFSW